MQRFFECLHDLWHHGQSRYAPRPGTRFQSSVPAMVQTLESRVLLSGAAPTISVTGGGTSASIGTYHDSPATFADGSLVQGSDPDGDQIQLKIGVDALHGTAAVDADGQLTYTPNAQFVGQDSFDVYYIDSEGLTSDPVGVNVSVTNTAPTLSANGQDPAVAQFSGYHDEEITSDNGYLNVGDNEGDTFQLNPQSVPSHGNLTFNSQDGSFSYMPDAQWVGQDSFTVAAVDSLGAVSTNTVTVQLNITNAAPVCGDDGVYNSVGGDVVRVSISELLSNDTDTDDSINPATFALGSVPLELSVRRVGDQLLIMPTNPPGLSDPAHDYSFTYTVSDPLGTVGTGTVNIRVTPASLHDAWIATINREEAKHIGYQYYTALGLGIAFTILRNNADLASYTFGSTGSAQAVYSPYYNTVTIATGTSTLNPSTVIHESIHIADDFNNWYLSDYGVGSDVQDAERLAWAGEQFLLASTAPLSSLRSFEDTVFDGTLHSEAFVMTKWNYVIRQWSEMPDLSYYYQGLGGLNYNDNIGTAGWGDFFSKFGLSGLGSVASVYMSALAPQFGPINLGSSFTDSPPNAPTTYTVAPPLW